ncbi:class I SAM-dependent DNA methyltransferase [Rhodovibrio salinarum]|uniref:Class I SAM-dependent methyltransferase n=1 Tax=Rhodovibrio salinarum TaxID=1087 RepID=A0A934QK16_9PROT|nr:class I SAM-dependent methyltransferase [Rhodovibrio salinarum]MBK1698132.1 class I SAM-dependent methyltransferase [Rhodovibrio salinarum]
MANTNQVDQLNDVYSAQSVDQIAKTYDDWAADYDSSMLQAGYRHPMICVGLLTRHVPAHAGGVLDAGQGTGLVGEWLKILGYKEVFGCDVSQGMLDRAEQRGVYDDLQKAALGGEPLPYPDARFAACVCAGVFTIGHADPHGLDDLLRVVRKGGHIITTVKDKLWDSGFKDHLEQLVKDGRCHVIETTPSYLSMPNQEGQSTSRALVLQVVG